MRPISVVLITLAMTTGAMAHENYDGIRNREGTACCNGQDCHRIVKEETIRILSDGGYVVKATGEFINESHVADSPNAEWHICRAGAQTAGGWSFNAGPVRCLMIPPGGM